MSACDRMRELMKSGNMRIKSELSTVEGILLSGADMLARSWEVDAVDFLRVQNRGQGTAQDMETERHNSHARGVEFASCLRQWRADQAPSSRRGCP